MKNGCDFEATCEFSPEEAQHIVPMIAHVIQIAQLAVNSPLLLPTTIEQQARVQLGLLAQQAMLTGNGFPRLLPQSNGDGHGPRPTATQSGGLPPDPEIPSKKRPPVG